MQKYNKMYRRLRASTVTQYHSNFLDQKVQHRLMHSLEMFFSKIMGNVGQKSCADVRNCLLTCKELVNSADDVQVFKNLKQHKLLRKSLLAVGNYTDLMVKCRLHANPTAQYV